MEKDLVTRLANMVEELSEAWWAQAAMPDASMENVTLPAASRLVEEARAYVRLKDSGLRRVGPCPCECNTGGFCGGCGHAGCGGRNR